MNTLFTSKFLRPTAKAILPLSIVLLSVCHGAALAQETDTDLYDGKWSARWQGAEGKPRAARVVVSNYGGTWQDLPVKGIVDQACAGKAFKITVQRSRTAEMQFMVWGSSVSPACPDLAVDLKPINGKTLEGTIGDGMKLQLVRR